MIGRQEILEFARDVGLNAAVVEKDYVLGWMLAGISAHAGDLLLYAVRSQDGEDRSYRVDRIVGANATRQTFTPRYQIELSEMGPLHIPDVSHRAPFPRSISRSSRRPHRTSSRGNNLVRATGPRYVFECTYCGKRFIRKQNRSTLKPHKTKDGYPCPGRTGYFVDMKY